MPAPESPIEGFDYLIEQSNKGADFEKEIKFPPKGAHKAIFIMPFYMTRIKRSINKSFKDLSKNSSINSKTDTLPNQNLWNELVKYAHTKWNISTLGFTKVPSKLVFQGRFVLFKYALVVIQEMKKEEINFAPKFKAGKEAIRVYASLGEIVNDISNWLRKKGVKCQATHPLRGLVMNPPLAGKAGLGWQGKQGLLITPEFGVRQRIAPIFIELPVFEITDSDEHCWIEEYCSRCGICARECPKQAIFDEKQIRIKNIEGIGFAKTCIDINKCFPQFTNTFGCSICVKVCPFSQGADTYNRLKKRFD